MRKRAINARDNRSEINLNHGYGYIHTTSEASRSKTNWLCVKHRTSTRGWMMEPAPKCPICQQPMILLGHRVRLPKKSASKWIWKNFLKLFDEKINLIKK